MEKPQTVTTFYSKPAEMMFSAYRFLFGKNHPLRFERALTFDDTPEERMNRFEAARDTSYTPSKKQYERGIKDSSSILAQAFARRTDVIPDDGLLNEAFEFFSKGKTSGWESIPFVVGEFLQRDDLEISKDQLLLAIQGNKAFKEQNDWKEKIEFSEIDQCICYRAFNFGKSFRDIQDAFLDMLEHSESSEALNFLLIYIEHKNLDLEKRIFDRIRHNVKNDSDKESRWRLPKEAELKIDNLARLSKLEARFLSKIQPTDTPRAKHRAL